MTGEDPDVRARRLAAASLAADDATGWFEELYAAAAEGAAVVPWDRGAPHPLLLAWTDARALDGAGRRAVVVGCGFGADAEHLAGLGFATVGFDISASAIEGARARFAGSAVDYRTADLLDPPAEWRGAFDLVVEIMTVQALPETLRAGAIGNVGCLVAPGGTLLVIASGRGDEAPRAQGPPWPLTRAQVESFATAGLAPVRIERLRDAVRPEVFRWRAECRRDR